MMRKRLSLLLVFCAGVMSNLYADGDRGGSSNSSSGYGSPLVYSTMFGADSLYFEKEDQHHYSFKMVNGRAILNNRIPAVVLDTVKGMVWTCQNLQDQSNRWVKTDLAKGDNHSEQKKYVVRMLEWQDANLRVPAIVLDTRKGITWICPNIVDEKAGWIRNDLAHQSEDSAVEGRYIVRIMKGRAIKNTRVPALVLDTVKGIVWTCQNLQDTDPLWVKIDLAEGKETNEDKHKYIVKMLEWQDADLRMPAMALDVEKGIAWNCPNIIDGKAVWLKTSLPDLAESN